MGIKQSSQNIRGCCRKLSGTSHGRFAYPLYSKDIETGEWLLNDIWQGGNFGQHNQNRKQRPKGYWSGNGTLSPAPLNDAVNSEPWHRPKHVGILSCSPFILLRYNGIKCGTEIK